MPRTWRNRVHHDDDTVEETKFKESEKDAAKKDHADKKLKLKKDEKATSHLCPGDLDADHEPESEWYDCRDDPRAEYEEFTKKTDLGLGDLLVPLPGPEP